MTECFIPKNFREEARSVIAIANEIITEYQKQGFTLTLRQLYYQFVARDYIPNKQAWYDKLGNIMSDARMAGLVDWNALEDRTRNIRKNQHWDSVAEILETVKNAYRVDTWNTQEYYVEVWIEKDALIGVIEAVCSKYDVTYFSCRGYVSVSEMHKAGQRMQRAIDDGRKPAILHLGDHDPSGIDMTFDIWRRLNIFCGYDHKFFKENVSNKLIMAETNWNVFKNGVDVRRLGLNQRQIDRYNPPPNPTKLTDSRAKAYIEVHGNESWELDSLSPRVLSSIIGTEIDSILDHEAWDERKEVQQDGREEIAEMIFQSTGKM